MLKKFLILLPILICFIFFVGCSGKLAVQIPTKIELPVNSLTIQEKPKIACQKLACVYELVNQLYMVNEQYEVQIKSIQVYVNEHNQNVEKINDK